MTDRLYPRARQTGFRRFKAWLVDEQPALVWSCPHKHTREWEAWYCAFEALRLKDAAFQAKERDKAQNEASSALTEKRKRYEAALLLIAEGTDKAKMRAIARSALWPWGNPSGTLREAMRG